MVIVDSELPAAIALSREENIEFNFEMDSRPLRVGIVNLMPLKELTERDLLRRLSASPLSVEVRFIKMQTHTSRNASAEHLNRFYTTFNAAISSGPLDGLIITGAPIENLAFEQVDYWRELTEIMDYARRNIRSTLYICWAAFAGLYHHHGIDKKMLSRKISGVFPHNVETDSALFNTVGREFFVPHSRYATVDINDIRRASDLQILSTSPQAGLYIASTADGREIYITGHSEYAPETLDFEYRRDLAKGINPEIPANYYRDDNPDNEIVDRWRDSSSLLFSNWLAGYVGK